MLGDSGIFTQNRGVEVLSVIFGDDALYPHVDGERLVITEPEKQYAVCDLVADAYRVQCDADIGIVGGGAIRVSIPAGDITMNDILSVHPFGNDLCVIEATGQQILDALEWGARLVPDQTGGFLQVSGLTYEIHTYIEQSCVEDENKYFVGITGERRVKNVMVGGVPIDPEATYTVAGNDYTLRENGDGYTVFDDCKLLIENVKLDNQALIA